MPDDSEIPDCGFCGYFGTFVENHGNHGTDPSCEIRCTGPCNGYVNVIGWDRDNALAAWAERNKEALKIKEDQRGS